MKLLKPSIPSRTVQAAAEWLLVHLSFKKCPP